MTTDRRIGIAVVLTAALILIAVNRVSGRDLPGQATVAPLPPIPAVGSCLNLRGARPAPVPCSRPHTAEVSQSWRDGQAPAEISGRCAGGNSGVTPGGNDGSRDWVEPVFPTTSVEVASGVPLGWEACVFVAAVHGDPTQLVSYRGSLIRSETGAEPVIGSCFASDRPQGGGRQQENPQIDCTRAHLAERVGEFLGATATAHPVSRCDEFARRQIGAAAFEGPDALRAVTGVDDSAGLVTVALGGADEVTVKDSSIGALIPMQTCSVVAPRPLVDTVLGIGNKPLPFG